MRAGAVAWVLLLLAGCGAVGPVKLGRDRLEYSEAVAHSWKSLTLLNIVKQRYLDLPLFLDVSGIVAGYQLESNATLADLRPGADGRGAFGAGVRYTDRPTISYKVLTGQSFTHALMTPLNPATVFFFMQSGWPADFIFEMLVAQANGLSNASGGVADFRRAEVGFLQVLRLLRLVQREGGVAFSLRDDENQRQFLRFHYRAGGENTPLRRAVDELHAALGVVPAGGELELVFGGLPTRPHQLALRTRSVLEVLSTMSQHIRLPHAEMAEGRAVAGLASGSAGEGPPGQVDIRQGPTAPADAFVQVRYRDRWYWIDDADLRSKRGFTFLMLILSMTGSESGDPPTLTIPVQ